MWAAHCCESPATSPNRDGEAAQVPRVFSLSPANQAGELIDAFLVNLGGENSTTPFGVLTSDQDHGGSFVSIALGVKSGKTAARHVTVTTVVGQ
jgi:hypothetical protein